MKKLISLLSLLIILTSNYAYSQNRITQEQIDRCSKLECRLQMNGDAIVCVRTDGKTNLNRMNTLTPVVALFTSPFNITYDNDFITSATFTPTGGTSIYDFQSNGVPVELWQSPIDPNQMHAVYMVAPLNDLSFANRRTNYYFSTNKGTTWTFISEVPTNVRSGYCTITGLSNNNVMVANHHTAGISRTFIYVDLFPGLGAWQELDPVLGPHYQAEWPRFIATGNIINPTKMVILSSANQTDTCWYNTGQSLSPPGTFSGWTYVPGAQNAEKYAIARGQDGRIGVAYTVHPYLNPWYFGDVFFMESTNDGATFSTPLRIYSGNTTIDSLGVLGDVSIVYQGNQPKVIFTVVTLSPSPIGNYFPGGYSFIRCWSPTFPGINPNKSVIVADSNNVPWQPYIFSSASDGLSGICKPNIGISADSNVLFSGFMVASAFTGGSVDTLSFFDVYFTASGDGGLTWKTPVKITPDSPRRDWTYTSISPWNDIDSNNWYANLLIQSDSIPGSFVNHTVNGQSLAQLMFVRVVIERDTTILGVKNISNEIPGGYRLYQNYPNPFNPTTKIRFDLRNSSHTKLIVYDILGKEIAVLVNEKLSAGSYEVEWSGSDYPSGVYFYKLVTDDFVDVKKMILIK